MSSAGSTVERGFALVEVMIALIVLAVGVLGIAQVMTFTLAMSSDSGADLIAHEKATEAAESVFTARDTQTITWAQIRNVSQSGVFLDAAQPLRTAGDDGLINTGDMNELPESVMMPGPDAALGTGDDVAVQLSQYTRQITIIDVPAPTPNDPNRVNPNLRQIRITITYRSDQRTRTFVLDTFISAFA